MTKKNQIIISAASVSAALSAVLASSTEQQVLDGPSVTIYDAAALDAISTAKSQAMVISSFPSIARTIRLDIDFGRAAYAELAMGVGDTGEGGGEGIGQLFPPNEPEIQYNEHGIPITLLEQWDNDGAGQNAGGDGGTDDFDSAEDMIAQRGLKVPDGMDPETYVATLEALYADVFGYVNTVPDQISNQLLTEAGSALIDSTRGDHFSCYNNCHSACHGSRGWR